MFRGVSKQVVVIKDTGSDMFEQAIFIVNPKSNAKSVSDMDMAREAKRIVSNCIRRYCSGPAERAKQRDRQRLLMIGGAVLLGAAILVALLMFLL